MKMLPDIRFGKFLRNESIDRPLVTPIMMRYAAEFINKSYREFYLDHKILVEAALRCHERFGFDMAMVISDPYRETEAVGGKFEYPSDNVPKCRVRPIENIDNFDFPAIPIPWENPRMNDRVEACALLRKKFGIAMPVLGWIEGPMAQMTNLRGMNALMLDFIDEPAFISELLDFVMELEKSFALAQIQAGADWIGIGDAAVSLISPALYRKLIFPKHVELTEFIHQHNARVKVHICGNITNHLPDLFEINADIIDLDWMVPISEAMKFIPPQTAICGNFDPVEILLKSSPEKIFESATKCLNEGKGRLILSPGCEVPPGTPEANVAAFCSADAFEQYKK